AYKTVPGASFWILAGDLTTEPTLDSLWAELFYAGGFIPRGTPFMPVPGNHEYRKNPKMDSKQDSKKKSITPLWQPHFTLPENGIPSLKETSYFFDYQDVRFIMLNGTEDFTGQIPWLEKVLSENKCKWTVVTMHQPVYSMGKGRDNKEIRESLVPVYDKYHVDLVLQGHDHTYGRTFKLRNNEIVDNKENGTIYVVSVSGPKAYELNPLYAKLMAKTGEKTQLFQEISIDGGHLIYKSYTVTGKLFDSFELRK
ncbi:MAG: metallophosphoesterase, partial [Melioribacteraceae bacterium]